MSILKRFLAWARQVNWQTEPVVIMGIIKAVLAALAGAGLTVSDHQVAAITAYVTAACLVLAAFLTREKTFSPATVAARQAGTDAHLAAASEALANAGPAVQNRARLCPAVPPLGGISAAQAAANWSAAMTGPAGGFSVAQETAALSAPRWHADAPGPVPWPVPSYDPPASAAGTHPQYKLGRRVNHDEQSRQYAIAELPAEKIVSRRWARRAPVFDQGQVGSCFPPGTHVRMADGSERAIEDVRLGERVMTAEGGTGRVVRTLLRDEDGGLMRLVAWGHAHLRMTREHPVLTARGYIPAAELRVGDEVALPRSRSFTPATVLQPRELVRAHRANANSLPEKIVLDAAAGRLFGLWLAEGSADGTKVRWHYGGHEGETLVPETVRLIRDVLGVESHAAQRPNGGWWVTLYGTPWNALFKLLGGARVESKRPHPILCSGDREFLEGMLDGWLAGDGHIRPDGTVTGSSVSQDLALAMYDIAQMAGRHPAIARHEAVQNSAAGKRLPFWELWLSPGPGRCRQTDSHVWRKVREVRLEDYVGPVYDLTVEGAHSYVAEGIGVHNCTGNAAAGWVCTDDASRQGIATLADGTPVDEKLAVAIYSAAETIDGDGPYPPNDNGSSGLSVAKVLKQRGLCSSYLHAFSLAAVYTALQSGPGMAGTVWYNSMFDTATDGHIHVDKTSGEAGGHEYLIDELEVDASGAVSKIWMQNSWGTGWGVKGRGWFTPSEFAALLAAQGDFTVPAPAVVPAPTPPPGPTPAPSPTPGPADSFPVAVAAYAGLADWLAARADKKGMTPDGYAAWILAGEAHKR